MIKKPFINCLGTESITPTHLEEALAIHTLHRTPMRDILGSMGYVNPKDYAAQLAQANHTGYMSDLVGFRIF